MHQEVEHCKHFHGLRVSCNGLQLPWLPVPSLAAQLFSETFLDFCKTVPGAVMSEEEPGQQHRLLQNHLQATWRKGRQISGETH